MRPGLPKLVTGCVGILLILAGCDSTAPRASVGKDCSSGLLCETGATCFEGVCRPEQGFACDERVKRCVTGLQCEGGVCVGTGGAACGETALCAKAFVCVAGTCASQPGGACGDKLAIACATGLVCIDSVCRVGVGGACDGMNASCATDLRCEGGLCMAMPGGACTRETDCIDGYQCFAGTCRGNAGAQCTDTLPCLPALACEAGSCRVGPGAVCSDLVQCRSGLRCEGGHCLGTSGAICDQASDCAAGFVCHAGKCHGEPGARCSNPDAPCAPGSVCEDGLCKVGRQGACGAPPQLCAAGLVCENGTCLLGQGGSPCDSSNDCASAFACYQGRCVGRPGSQCAPQVGCTADAVCVDGTCLVSVAGACSATIRCRAGLRCEDGTCRLPAGSDCAADAECQQGLTCHAGKCMGLPGADCSATAPCSPAAVCELGSCRGLVGGACGTGSPCSTGLVCDAGQCRQPPGATCTGSDDCTTGFACHAGRCEGMPGSACGVGVSCVPSAVCEAGLCRALSGGTCSDTVPCSSPLLCDGGRCASGAGATCVGPTDCASFLSCSVGLCRGGSGTACTTSSQCLSGWVCDGGRCKGATGTACATAQTCETGLSCESGVCLANLGGACGSSADCVSGLSCSGGSCRASVGGSCAGGPDCVAGASCEDTLCRAGSGGACTEDAGCSGQLLCLGGLCGSAGCLGKSCTPGSGGSSRVCQRTALPSTASCNDGLFCTQGDHCDGAGACVGGGPRDCAASVGACLVAACDETQKRCVASGNKPDGTSCDADASGCTAADSCRSGVCAPGPAPDCTAVADTCNTGSCRSTGATTYACDKSPKPAGTACAGGRYCTVSEKCDGAGTCGGGQPRDCAAQVGDTCNGATCSDAAGSCVRSQKADGTLCDDGNACTLFDKCTSGLCKGPQNVCTEERINIATNANTSKPAMASLGGGRYVIQWSAPVDGANYVRISDAQGSRENEEVGLPNAGGVMGTTPSVAAKANGDFLAAGASGSFNSYSYGGAWVAGVPALLQCLPFTLSDAATVAGISGCQGSPSPVWPLSASMMNSVFNTTGAPSPSVGSTISPLSCTARNCNEIGCSEILTCSRAGVTAVPKYILLPLSDGSLLHLDVLTSARIVPVTATYTAGTAITLAGIPAASADMLDAAVVPDGYNTFIVTWVSGSAVMAQRFTSAGVNDRMPTPITVTTMGGINMTRVLPFSDSTFLVLWDANNGDGAGRGIRGQFVLRDGTLYGASFVVNKRIVGDQRLGDAARFSDDSFVVVYDDSMADGDYGVRAMKFSAAGIPEANDIAVNTLTTGNQVRPAVITLTNDEWVVSFSDGNNAVWTRRFKKDGSPSQGRLELRGNATTAGAQTAPRLAISASDAVLLAYESPGTGTDQKVLGRIVDASGNETKAEFQVNTTIGKQFEPAVAGGPDMFVLLWTATSATTPGDDDVKGQLVDGQGKNIGPEFTANSTLRYFQRQPAVAMNKTSGDFIATWNAYGAGISSSDVMARVFDKTGTQKMAEFRVNEYTDYEQRRPAATVIPTTGDYVVGWESNGQDGSGYGVWIRKFLASGVPATSETIAHSTVAGDQVNIALAASSAEVVACWETPTARVACQYFTTANLTRIGGEFFVAPAGLALESPTVAALPGGDFLVGWAVTGADSAGKAVQYVRLSSSGQTISSRVVANRTWALDQWRPQLGAFSTGNLIVGWQSEGQDGDSSGVIFRLMPGQ